MDELRDNGLLPALEPIELAEEVEIGIQNIQHPPDDDHPLRYTQLLAKVELLGDDDVTNRFETAVALTHRVQEFRNKIYEMMDSCGPAHTCASFDVPFDTDLGVATRDFHMLHFRWRSLIWELAWEKAYVVRVALERDYGRQLTHPEYRELFVNIEREGLLLPE